MPRKVLNQAIRRSHTPNQIRPAVPKAKAYAVLRIQFQSVRQLRAISDALRPETTGRKARTVIVQNSKELILRFEAGDSRVLRAVMSSYLRMIRAALNSSNALLALEGDSPRAQSDKD